MRELCDRKAVRGAHGIRAFLLHLVQIEREPVRVRRALDWRAYRRAGIKRYDEKIIPENSKYDI